jgi:hypothetical protein
MRTRIGLPSAVLCGIATVALFAATPKAPVSLDEVITLSAGETTSVKLPAGPLMVEEFVVGNLPEAQDIERSKSHPDDKLIPDPGGHSNPGTPG